MVNIDGVAEDDPKNNWEPDDGNGKEDWNCTPLLPLLGLGSTCWVGNNPWLPNWDKDKLEGSEL